MADTKIASLTDGTSTSATDRIPVAISPYGSGNNAYITPAYLKTFMVTGGTVTTSTPVFDMTQTWNAGAQAFTGLKLNVTDTASASGSLLADMQVGSVSRFAFRKNGTLTLSNGTQSGFIDPYNYVGNRSGTMYIYNQNASGILALGVTNSVCGLTIDNAGTVGFFNGADTAYLKTDTRDTLAMQNGTSAQQFRVYGTSSSANANFERVEVGYNSSLGIYGVLMNQGGTGAAQALYFGTVGSNNVAIITNSTARWIVNSSGGFLAVTDNTNDIGASGANRPRNVYVANNIITGGVLMFGGTTSIFPALKRNSGSLEVRAADDSGFASLQCAGIVANGDLVVGIANKMRFGGGGGRVDLTSPADKVLKVAGNAGGASIVQLQHFTVAGLPSAVTYTGSVAFVSDANATTARSTVAGGGSNKVMVMSDGADWLIVA